MAINTQTIRIDLNPGRSIPVAYSHQGDTARSFVFEVYNNGEAFPLTGYTAKIAAMLPADNGYRIIAGDNMADGAISGNTITATLPADFTAKPGRGVLTIVLTGSGATIRPINVDLRIQKSADAPETIAGASDFAPVLERYMAEDMQTYINAWLDDHPEATTTVEDFSLTYKKLVRGTLGFVTPEMYGAVGDGVTDDTTAVQEAINSRLPVYLSNKYLVTNTLTITRENTMLIGGNYGQIVSNGNTILKIGNDENVLNNTYIFNVTFICNNEAPAINIDGYRVNKLYIYNCDFDMFKDYGILVKCPTGYNYIEKCRFYTTEANAKYIHFGISGSDIAINYWYIRHNAFEFGTSGDSGLNKDAIYMESGIVMYIEDNDFANWNSGNCINITPSETCNNVNINNNIFYNIGNANCIYVNRQLQNKPLYDLTVKDNFFDSESRTGKSVYSSADSAYYITDVFLGKNKIKGTWTEIYNINKMNNIYLSELELVEGAGTMPAVSGLCTYGDYSNVHLPAVKNYFAVNVPAGESVTASITVKNIPHSLQFYVPTLYNSHSTGSGVLITGSDFNNNTGVITITLTSSAQGPRYCIVSII